MFAASKSCLPDESRRIRTFNLAANVCESRKDPGVLGRPFSPVPGCSRHAGPQRDRSHGPRGPQATRLSASGRLSEFMAPELLLGPRDRERHKRLDGVAWRPFDVPYGCVPLKLIGRSSSVGQGAWERRARRLGVNAPCRRSAQSHFAGAGRPRSMRERRRAQPARPKVRLRPRSGFRVLHPLPLCQLRFHDISLRRTPVCPGLAPPVL
jgi:hypothetical protein